jgi:hypothetical protein
MPESAAITAVSLPDPAPGFPLRRETDGVHPTGFGPGSTFWTATFLLGVTPPDLSTPTPGVVTGTPTAAEATVLVIDGHPFDLSAPTRIDDVPVAGTTQVQGQTALVTKSCDQTDLYFSTGRFQVLIAGFPGSTDVETLVTLGNAIHGLQ